MPRVTGVRLTTADGKNSAVAVEYENGAIYLIVPHELAMPSPVEPSAATIRVLNLLKEFGTDLLNIERNQITIEWWPTS
jgi:hypothetical protein